MNRLKCSNNFSKVWLLVGILVLLQNGESYMIRNNPHHLREVISNDPENPTFQLEWLVDLQRKRITFNVTAKTTGFVGFGLSDSGKMTGADIVIGGVDSKTGRPYFADYHAIGNQQPVKDPVQNWNLLHARENATHTMLSFSRSLDTCDNQDYAITEDQITLIWAIGQRDEIRYHHGDRGTYGVYLLHPDYSPQIVTEPRTGIQRVLDQNNPGRIDHSVKTWTIRREMNIPTQETLYWCTMHQAPRLHRKHQLIGANVRLHSEEAIRHVHHFVVLKCTPPRGNDSLAAQMFESHRHSGGHSCYGPHGGPLPMTYCTEYRYIWAVGGRSSFHPPHIGFPFESDAYYILQVHLNNPTGISNVRVDMSVDLFYSEKVRPNEGGYLALRHEVPGLPPSLLIPPRTVDHTIRGICGSQCSREIIPPEGITIYGTLLHTHNAGRRIRVRHFRGKQEESFIASDENYSFNYQQVKNLNVEKKILPGDQMIVECVYDSSMRNTTVVGGYASNDEMCIGFLMHYQRLPENYYCASEIVSVDDRRYFLAGVTNVTWSMERLAYLVNAPHPLAGLTVAEVSDSEVDWTLGKREDLQNYHLYRPHVNRCGRAYWTQDPVPNLRLMVSGVPEGLENVGPTVAYPYDAKPYQPPQPCISN